MQLQGLHVLAIDGPKATHTRASMSPKCVVGVPSALGMDVTPRENSSPLVTSTQP